MADKEKEVKKIKKIFIDYSKCVGCYNCVLACTLVHNTATKNIYDLQMDNTRLNAGVHFDTDIHGRPIPLVCRHCDEPECVYTCISGAMTKDEETGVVSHNPKKCVSCFLCVMSCPYGVLSTDKKTGRTVIKCDFCKGEDGPACAKSCPTGAIYVEEVDKYEVFDLGG